MINLHKKHSVIHDGLEYDFVHKENYVSCPICKGNIMFSVFNSDDFNKLNNISQDNIARGIKRLMKNENEYGLRYTYERLPLRVDYTKCDLKGHDFAVVFTFGEIQNTRYKSHLLGLFQVTKEQLEQNN